MILLYLIGGSCGGVAQHVPHRRCSDQLVFTALNFTTILDSIANSTLSLLTLIILIYRRYFHAITSLFLLKFRMGPWPRLS